MLRFLGITCSVLLFTPVLYGQFGSGLQGTVADPTAALIPGVRVVATNIETGVSREANSSEEGVYRIPSLSPGTYKVAASKEGFGRSEYSVTVAVNEVRRVDFTLSVGNVTETVTVSAQPTILETEEGRISGHIETKQLRDLPIPNRNVFNLLSMQPG